MNHLGAEMSILLEVWDVDDPVAEHLPGKLNDQADYLSRLASPERPPEPPGLSGLKVREVVRKGTGGRGYVLPTPVQEPALWASRSEGEDGVPPESSRATRKALSERARRRVGDLSVDVRLRP